MTPVKPKPQLAVQERPLAPSLLRHWRTRRGLGQGGFGKLFKSADWPNGYHRSYISKLERGLLPITTTFAKRFEAVRARWQAEHPKGRGPGRDLIRVFSKRRLPRTLYILRPVVRCKCGRWFEQVNARHRKCTPTCKGRKRKGKGRQP